MHKLLLMTFRGSGRKREDVAEEEAKTKRGWKWGMKSQKKGSRVREEGRVKKASS